MRKRNHCASEAAMAMDLYSASDDDHETVFRFLLFHEMRALPKKKHHHVTNFLVFRQVAQYESE
ncbi:hypothetical protein TanjilG_25086 [Lupinus angustifolius]|uniref:Uncharacterized protein n=1 Tax=Lupinus angustifolius TaxID=3871 RepID=A0A394DCQ6_LUPAN|nr:hypothetical protein TanjilG_25086 [Lupinus angustifolius]